MCETKSLVYLDHAATSFPKPASVISAVSDFLRLHSVNPGRSGYDLSVQTGQNIDRVRQQLGTFFGNPVADPNHTIFTANATDALNMALSGLCRPGDHVISTSVEHNSVLRPLHMLHAAGIITFDLVAADASGFVSPSDIAAAMGPRTRLVVMTHASNVVGSIQPVAEVGILCRDRGVKFLVDAAQTAGSLGLDMSASHIDLVAFTGHKGLQGPPGIGGLIIGADVEISSTRWGGTGVRSAQLTQPQELPYRLETGTLNGMGIAGLRAGLSWVLDQGLDQLLNHERRLAHLFTTGCAALPRVSIHGHGPGRPSAREAFTEASHLPLVSLSVAGLTPEAIGMFLDVEGGVAVRTGLHCAPLLHRSLGTYEAGTVRFSFGPTNCEDDVEQALKGLANLP